jgi:NitT/TauT family transport system substrate-binding protein
MRRLGLLLALVICVALSGAASAGERLVVGYTNYQGAKIVLPLAKEAGLFANHGLDVEMVRVSPGNLGVPQLQSGKIDLFVGNGDPVVKAIVRDGAKLTMIASLGQDTLQLVARAPIKNADDLKGRKIGISSAGSSTDRFTRLSLKALGLDPDRDVHLVATGLDSSKARLDLVVKGDIDASIADLENVKALDEKSNAVISIAELEKQGIFVSGADVSTSRSLIESRREAVEGFLTALVEAIAKAKSDPDFASRIYRQYAKVTDPAVLDWRTHDFIQTRIPSIPYPNREALNSYLRDARQGEGNPEAIADFSLLGDIAARQP